MVLRLKTIEYAFPENTSTLAAATLFEFSAITLSIPENTSRTFMSVIVEVHALDGSTAATSMTSWLIGIKLGAATFNNVTVTDTLTHSGENQTWMFTRDVASYFNTNFGTDISQTCQIAVQFGGVATRNITAKLIITYEFNDTGQQTRIKTVRIPLESNTGALTTTLTEIGTNQVPALDTFLPESSKVYRNIWFEVMGNQGTTTTTDTSLNLALDAEAANPDFVHENALASDVWFKRIWVRDTMATNQTHQFKMSVSAGGFPCNHLAILLCVTYEYDHTNSTTILNSLMMPINESIQRAGATTPADKSLFTHMFYIEEPGTITMVQSGVQYNWASTAGINPNVSIGSQAYRTYTSSGNVVCGQFSLMQRCDSGSAQNQGFSLARGLNTVNVSIYHATADNVTIISVILYLNYTSGKASGGADAHNKTIIWSIADHAGDALTRNASFAPSIPETSYWLNSVALLSVVYTAGLSTLHIVCERVTGELQGAGWVNLLQVPEILSDAERGIYILTSSVLNFFDRYPNEQQDRLNIQTTRPWRMYIPTTLTWLNLIMCFTYHSMTFTKSGTIGGSAGGTVSIGLWRKVNNIPERLDTTSRVGDGPFSFTWYDDTEAVFVEAREDATHVGRSDDGTA